MLRGWRFQCLFSFFNCFYDHSLPVTRHANRKFRAVLSEAFTVARLAVGDNLNGFTDKAGLYQHGGNMVG